MQITCFKAYDIRGQISNELNADIAYRIGNATVEFLAARRIVVGRDIRQSSEELMQAVSKGIRTRAPKHWISALVGPRVHLAIPEAQFGECSA